MLTTVITSIITAFGTALVTALASFLMQERRMRFEFAQMRTEFMAEQVARQLLEHPKWKRRSFEAIKYRLGGFSDEELQKILVRAGAIRFKDSEGKEYWGLIHRNSEALNS
ncbi:MAG: hypothetical protein SAJ37_17330 [Oscillatoria sp. PMC 1068.18]|nr:hypothetical protein [Oscillatoria sp. PMC 1076.18]MEC4990496.1 hypothetical protein [Oscillatoria sp. PMC 1068.18]